MCLFFCLSNRIPPRSTRTDPLLPNATLVRSTFNHDTNDIAADPVHRMYVLEVMVRQEQFPAEVEARYLEFIKGELAPRYAEFIGNEIQKAYLESYHDYGQNLFDRYEIGRAHV